MSNQDSLSEALSDILDTLAGVSQGAFRLIGPQGTIVAQAGTDAENCRLIRSCHGSDYCRRNCWQGARASLSGIIECASKAVQIVIPLTFGGQFLGNLYCGDFRLADHSELCQDESVWKGIAEGLKLDPKRLIEAHCALRVKTRTELEQLQQNLRKLLEDQILDKLLELRIKEVKTYIVKLDEVPRGELWHGIEDEVRLLARVGTFEIFTVASGRDAITRECPPVETWDGKERYQDFEQAAARGYYTDADNRLVIALQYEDRLLAFMRVSSVQLGGFQSGDRDSERLRKLGDAIAEALSLRRHQRAEKMMGELYKELQGLQDHRERLRIILIKCLKLLDCQHGEVLLRKPSDPMRLEVVVRHGIAEELLPLPSYTSGTQGLLKRVLTTEQVVTVPDTRLDREFQEQTDAAELRGKYPDNIRENLVRYQKSIRACIKIPLIVGQEVRGVMCLHREQESHFYLGMVHVVELLAKNAAGELACVLVSDEYSARAEGFRARISTRDSLMKLVDGFDLGTARHKLFNSLANEAKELSGALRAAVAVINEPWTKVSVLAATSGWPIDRFELAIPLRKVDGEKSGVLTAIMEGHSYTVQDVNSLEAQYFSPDGDREKVVSSANIRMECGPNLLGVLVLDWTTPQSFDPVVRGMLESLAKSYAEAIHAYEVHHLTLLLDKLLRAQSEEIDRVPEHAWKFQPLLAHAARMFGVAEGSLFIRNRDTGLFDLKASLMQPELVERVDQSYALGEGLTGWIAQNNRAIHIRDLRNSADLHRAAPGAVWKNKIKDNDHADVQDRSTSFLGAPLSMGSEVLGVLRFNIDTKRRPFDIFDESLAESIAARMGDWLYDRDEVIRRLAQLKLLEQILTCKDIDQLVELIYIAIEAGVGRIGCHVRMRDRIQEGRDREPEEVFLLKGKPRRPYWIDPRNQGTPWQGPSRFHRSHEDATGHVWEKRETLYDPDVKAVDSKCRQVQTPSWFLENVGSVVVTPLMGNEKIVGTLHVYKPNPMSFSPAEVDFIEDVARIASNGLMSLQARERVNSDMSLRQVTDAAIQQHLSAPESPRLRMQLMQDLLHVLTNHLRARQGWFLWPDESRQAFKVMESSGAPVAVVPPIPISHLDAILRDKGFQLAFGLGMDDEIQKWVGSWKCTDNNRSEYLKRAQERQYLLIAMQDTHHTSTVFCIEAAPDHVISFDEAQHLKKILNQIHQSFNLAVEYLKNLEREQRRFEEAAKPLGLIGATASSMEHNFRRPVDNMIKTLEYLMTNPREPNQIQKKLTYMMGQVDSLNSSVHQLISVSAGKQHSAAVPLVPILEAAIEKARLIIPHIFLKPGAENVLVHAAARLLGNALELLLMNAAEAVASRGADALVSVGVTATDSVCEIRIVDNGPGMDVANSMRPFVSTKGKERGLGLPTALFLIRIQDGRLDIQPEEGRGTTVIVTLPIGKGV